MNEPLHVVMPCYNEQENIKDVILSWDRAISQTLAMSSTSAISENIVRERERESFTNL